MGHPRSAHIFEALGTTKDFFIGSDDYPFTLTAFKYWLRQNVIDPDSGLAAQIAGWLPESIAIDRCAWVRATAVDLLMCFTVLADKLSKGSIDIEEMKTGQMMSRGNRPRAGTGNSSNTCSRKGFSRRMHSQLTCAVSLSRNAGGKTASERSESKSSRNSRSPRLSANTRQVD
jgi:hypothetical protein